LKFEEIPPCKTCGQQFNNIFEATDHLLEDENAGPFDPKLILPGGYQLMIGALLRVLYDASDNPQEIRDIAESTYATLYAAESSPKRMKRYIEDIVINEEMRQFDSELIHFLADTDEKDGE